MPLQDKPGRLRVVGIEDNFDSITDFTDLIDRTLATQQIEPEDIVDVALTQQPLESPAGRRRLTALIFIRVK